MPSVRVLLVPLRQPVFRRIWLASLFSNLGLLIQGVGSAWAMTQLSKSALLVALVQSAIMLPTMFFSLIAGALADMYDRRIVALCGLSLSLCGASLLVFVSYCKLLTPFALLTFCFIVGCGQALFGPAWQASVREQVPPDALKTAVGLNSVSYNIARSFGPAVGGIIVAAGGSISAFTINALFYLPLFLMLLLWRRVREVPRLPPEQLLQAVTSGIRYVANSPPICTALLRTVTVSFTGGVILALLPLVARDTLHAGARVYGLMLGMFGIGSVIGALGISVGHRYAEEESAVRVNTLVLAVAVAVVAGSHSAFLTGAALIAAGTSWLSLSNSFNVCVQMTAPRWVSGRALSAFQATISGGVATGSWLWGALAGPFGVGTAMFCAAGALALLPLLAIWFPMPKLTPEAGEMPAARADTKVVLPLTTRSGPIIIAIEYRIDPRQARDFYRAIQELQLSRRRNGAKDWSIARDIDDPALWTERFQCATWLEFLRHRDRPTLIEQELQRKVAAFHCDEESARVRRMLGRPFGSVRWKDTSPDIQSDDVMSPTARPNMNT